MRLVGRFVGGRLSCRSQFASSSAFFGRDAIANLNQSKTRKSFNAASTQADASDPSPAGSALTKAASLRLVATKLGRKMDG